MKYLIMCLMLAGCAAGGSGGPPGASPNSAPPPTPGAAPSNGPAPSPSPSPSPRVIPTCAPVLGTDWIATGAPVLTMESQDQSGHGYYVSEFNLTGTGDFTQSQFVGGSLGTLTCTRKFSDGVSNGANSLVWSDNTGFCGVLSNWMQFDNTTCNQLVVTVRDGSGQVYLTQTYVPK